MKALLNWKTWTIPFFVLFASRPTFLRKSDKVNHFRHPKAESLALPCWAWQIFMGFTSISSAFHGIRGVSSSLINRLSVSRGASRASKKWTGLEVEREGGEQEWNRTQKIRANLLLCWCLRKASKCSIWILKINGEINHLAKSFFQSHWHQKNQIKRSSGTLQIPTARGRHCVVVAKIIIVSKKKTQE